MWTTENRPRYNRDKLRYPSDLTDEEWSLVEPLIPPAKRGGRKREVEVREVVNGVMYVLSTGCQWRYIPKDLPPRSTVHDYLTRWNYDGTIEKIHYALYVQCREADRPGGQPDRLRDRQPEREKRGKRGACIDPPGYDAGKKIKGKKRHILVDTVGLLLHAMVHPADIQDRDGGVSAAVDLVRAVSVPGEAVRRCRLSGTAVRHGRGKGPAASLGRDRETFGPGRSGFVVLPMRWVVERTLAWLNRCRRLAKDFENLSRNALAFLQLASIRLMLRKLCNPK